VPITENDVIEIFNVEPMTAADGNNQVFVWRNKVELSVYYHSYCTSIFFRLYDKSMREDYLSMSLEEQMRRVAEVVGCNENNLYFYDTGDIAGQEVSMFGYIDKDGVEADFLIVLFSDGIVSGYYSDGTFRNVEGLGK
jgi:hypothetical protein